MKSRIYTVIILLALAVSVSARPAKGGLFTFTQPDGTTFQGRCFGHEFFKVKTTESGHSIIRQEDGWWCYAIYMPDGTKQSTGYHVGDDAPQSVLAESLNRRHPSTGRRYKARPQTFLRTKAEEPSVKHAIVILAAYSDVDFSYTRNDFVNMLTQDGYSVNGATGCAKEYFDNQFNGTIDFMFDVSSIVRLDNTRKYYGENDSYGDDMRPAEMVRDACLKADDEIDFSQYDDDGDGYADNVFVFFAGGDEAENLSKEEYVWSHAWYLSEADISLKLDGTTIDSYACTSELTKLRSRNVMTGIGTFCHEYSHTFGLPDFYDTDYDDAGGWAAGLWLSTSLMDGGNANNNGNTPPYYNAIERELLGLTVPVPIVRNGSYTLEPIGTSGQCYRLDTDTDGEYFLFECRSADKWDKYIGGSGLLVYHIDRTESRMDKWTFENTVNANATHQCADLIEADARVDYFNSEDEYYDLSGSIKGVFYPFGSESILQDNKPSLKLWNGRSSGISITHIEQNSDGSITFNVSGFDGEEPPLTSKINIIPFPDAAVISFESDIPHTGDATVSWGPTGKEKTTVKVAPYKAGKYALVLENLMPDSKSYTVSVHFEVGELKGRAKEASFLTKRSPSVSWPFMFIINDEDSSDNRSRILLRIANASEAEEISWSFNGKDTTPDPDGWFTFTQSGIIRAEVFWEDGSMDIIEKAITVNRHR